MGCGKTNKQKFHQLPTPPPRHQEPSPWNKPGTESFICTCVFIFIYTFLQYFSVSVIIWFIFQEVFHSKKKKILFFLFYLLSSVC